MFQFTSGYFSFDEPSLAKKHFSSERALNNRHAAPLKSNRDFKNIEIGDGW